MLKAEKFGRKSLKSLTLFMACGLALSPAIACKQKSTAGRSGLRSSTYQAPFSATLSASADGWQVDISQNGGPATEYAVADVSYIASAGPAPGVTDGAPVAGTVSVSGNLNYTFQFHVTKSATNVTALCETTYAAPLRFMVEPVFVKCNADFSSASNNAPGGNGADPSGNTSVPELDADRAMGFAIMQYKVTINDALASLQQDGGYRFSGETVTRWNNLASKVKQIIERYAGNAAGAIDEVLSTVQNDVQVADNFRVSDSLIEAYTRPANQNTVKNCVCTVAVCTAGECSDPAEETIPGITDAAACAAKSRTLERQNSDPSSLLNDGQTTKEFSACSMR